MKPIYGVRIPKISDQTIELLKLQFAGPGASEKLESARIVLRDRAQKDLWFFNRYVLEFPDVGSEFHVDLCQRWQARVKRRFTLWLAPRGHLKTTCLSEGGTLWQHTTSDIRSLVVNAKLENAIAILANIRMYTRTKEVFRWLFPEFCVDLVPGRHAKRCKDVHDRLDFPCSQFVGRKEGNIEVMSAEASLVSKHYDNQLYDDAVNDENTTTKDYRDKIFTWYKNSLQLRHDPNVSTVKLIGTRWHFDDLYSRLIKEEMRHREKQAISGKKVKPRYLIYVRSAQERDATGELKPVWKERFNSELLEEIKGELGSYLYSCHYENNPLPEGSAIFKYNDIKPIDQMLIPDEVVNMAAVDLALEDTKTKDHTVITVASFDKDGKMYVREIYRDKVFPLDLINKIIELQKKWKLVRVAVEQNAFQNTIYKSYKREAEKQRVYVPWVEMTRGPRSNKFKRIVALQPRVERGDFFYEEGIENTDWLIEEMVTFDQGAHDDILDTLADLESMYYKAPVERMIEKPRDTLDALYGSLVEPEEDSDSMELSETATLFGE